MAVIRNDDSKLHQLVAIAIQNATVTTFDRVDIPPGRTVEVEDRFLDNEGTQASIAEGKLFLVDGPAEAPPEAGGDQTGDQPGQPAKKGRGGK